MTPVHDGLHTSVWWWWWLEYDTSITMHVSYRGNMSLRNSWKKYFFDTNQWLSVHFYHTHPYTHMNENMLEIISDRVRHSTDIVLVFIVYEHIIRSREHNIHTGHTYHPHWTHIPSTLDTLYHPHWKKIYIHTEQNTNKS